MSAPMDSKGIDEKKNPDDYPIYKIFKLFATTEEDLDMRSKFEKGGVGYGDIKIEISNKINTALEPMRKKYDQYYSDPELVQKIITDGAIKATVVTDAKLNLIKLKG